MRENGRLDPFDDDSRDTFMTRHAVLVGLQQSCVRVGDVATFAPCPC